MDITAKKIAKGSVFKLYFIGLAGGFLPLFLIFGIAAIFGAETVKWEDTPITGFSGLFVSLAMWPLFSFMFTTFMWLISLLGLWLYSLIKPIKIYYVNSDGKKVENA